jgi:uncharacterized membrane protein
MADNVILRRRPPLLQPLLGRPHLVAAALFGLALYFASALWANREVTRLLVAWNGAAMLFLVLAVHFMRGADPACMKRRAIAHDEGRHLMLILTMLAAVASVGALVAELSAAKGMPGGTIRIGLAAGTVIVSWLFVQIVFAMHYAHVYYLAEEESAQHQGGLEFGDSEEPDYWDFVHFAIVLGATAQTADIVIRSKEMRRVGTLHTLVAFGFNTAILATMINLAANLF